MKLPDPKNYQTLIFDCDGVLLDSNRIKSEAFFTTASKKYGLEAASRLLSYHQENGGVSRYRKFEYFLREIVSIEPYENSLQDLLQVFAEEVRIGLANCTASLVISEFDILAEKSRLLVVSGGDERELRQVFKVRHLEKFFNGGIHGSPDSKENIIQRELALGNIIRPALFIGDSRYDHEVAMKFGFDFLFLSGWTEFFEWRKYQALHQFPYSISLEAWIQVEKNSL